MIDTIGQCYSTSLNPFTKFYERNLSLSYEPNTTYV